MNHIRTFRAVIHPNIVSVSDRSLDVLMWSDHPGQSILPYLPVGLSHGSLETTLYQYLDDMRLWLHTNEVQQLYTWMETDVLHFSYLVTVHPGMFEAALAANSTLQRWPLDLLDPHMVTCATDPSPDEKRVAEAAIEHLRSNIYRWRLWLGLMPEWFTLRQLQEACELILGRKLNKDAFRRKVMASGHLKSVGMQEEAVGHRPAALYGIVY